MNIPLASPLIILLSIVQGYGLHCYNCTSKQDGCFPSPDEIYLKLCGSGINYCAVVTLNDDERTLKARTCFPANVNYYDGCMNGSSICAEDSICNTEGCNASNELFKDQNKQAKEERSTHSKGHSHTSNEPSNQPNEQHSQSNISANNGIDRIYITNHVSALAGLVLTFILSF